MAAPQIPDRVTTYKAPSMFFGDNWCAKCSRCGTVLTKYCETEDQARREAESERCCLIRINKGEGDD